MVRQIAFSRPSAAAVFGHSAPVDLNLALRDAGERAREARRREPYIPPLGGYDDEDDADETRLRLTEEVKLLLKVLLCFAALGFVFGIAFSLGNALISLSLSAAMGMPVAP